MKQKIIPLEEFDKHYQKELSAVMVAIGYAMFIIAIGKSGLENLFYISNVIFAFVGANWVYRIAERQNRPAGWLSIFAFLLPIPMLIIMGLSRKKNLVFQVDKSYSSEEQKEALRKYAGEFMRKGKYDESGFVYKYLVSTYQYTDEDMQKYQELAEWSKHGIPLLSTEEVEAEEEEIPAPLPQIDIPLPVIPAQKREFAFLKKINKERTISIVYFFFLLICVFIHMVLVFNKPHKGAYTPDDKLYYLGEEYNYNHYIYPWWTLNFIYLVYCVSVGLYYMGYVKLPKRNIMEVSEKE